MVNPLKHDDPEDTVLLARAPVEWIQWIRGRLGMEASMLSCLDCTVGFNGQMLLIDTHGWMNEMDNGISTGICTPDMSMI